MMKVIRRTVPLALALALTFAVAAQASHFSNSTLDDIDFGPTEATAGSNLDFNIAEFDIGIEGSGGNFDSYISSDGSYSNLTGTGRFVYSFRSVNGSFSNSNENGTKRVWIEWLMTEPDTTKRSLYGALYTQKHDVMLRVTLYTTGGTTTYGEDELEDCSLKAIAKSTRDNENPNAVRISLTCKRGALEDLGFSDDQIDCIEEALETRSRTIRYVWTGDPEEEE